MQNEVSDLILSEDDFSLKVTRPTSTRFFVRIEPKKSDAKNLNFTDFTIEPSETIAGAKAIAIICETLALTENPKEIRFLDIYPDYKYTRNRDLLAQRHNQLVEVTKHWAHGTSADVSNSILREELGRYSTYVKILQSPE